MSFRLKITDMQRYCIQSLFLSVLAAFVLMASTAHAQKFPMHPTLQDVQIKNEADVEYLGSALGLDGYILRKDGRVQYGYTTKEGGMVIGILFGPDGNPVTFEQLQEYKRRLVEGEGARNIAQPVSEDDAEPTSVEIDPGASKSEQFFATVERASWVKVGSDSAPHMYVLINPNCDHCQNYWQNLKDFVARGQLQIRLVPFGAIEANREASAALLSAEKPGKAWQDFVDGDKGALSKDLVEDEKIYNAVDANTKMWLDWDLPTAPFTIYKSPADQKIKVIVGAPENTMLIMADFIQ